jgi:hypothetical protein
MRKYIALEVNIQEIISGDDGDDDNDNNNNNNNNNKRNNKRTVLEIHTY